MKLVKMGTRNGKPPLRTVTEIAEMLGITMQMLMWALKDADAPKASLRASEASHCVTGNNKVWYEPKAVLRWYRARKTPVAVTPEEQRREYHREYYRKNRSVAARLKEKENDLFTQST